MTRRYCAAPMPGARGADCVLGLGHRGQHRGLDGAQWPTGKVTNKRRRRQVEALRRQTALDGLRRRTQGCVGGGHLWQFQATGLDSCRRCRVLKLWQHPTHVVLFEVRRFIGDFDIWPETYPGCVDVEVTPTLRWRREKTARGYDYRFLVHLLGRWAPTTGFGESRYAEMMMRARSVLWHDPTHQTSVLR